ncbi:hypothetical protein [Ruegeria atlantica]|uniref:hypothetical protein n=1 Tax=Ruegeria atlantica TaxID=81569 RepID=UPI00147F95D9|nr:hypothetical protein [Ruegeria atlantica]
MNEVPERIYAWIGYRDPKVVNGEFSTNKDFFDSEGMAYVPEEMVEAERERVEVDHEVTLSGALKVLARCTAERDAARKHRRFLWDLLDQIDTLHDACKDDDASFRELARDVQQRRHEINSSDGDDIVFNDDKAKRTDARAALIRELETFCATPEDAVGMECAGMMIVVFTALLTHGGDLTVQEKSPEAQETPDGQRRVFLRLHGLAVRGCNMEEALTNWLAAARASVSEGTRQQRQRGQPWVN